MLPRGTSALPLEGLRAARAGAALLAVWVGLDLRTALLICAAVTLILRAGSIGFGWRLPVYKSMPPRADAPKMNVDAPKKK